MASSSNPPPSESQPQLRQTSYSSEYNLAKKAFEQRLWSIVLVTGGYSGGNYSSSGSKSWFCPHCKTSKSSSIARVRYHLLGCGKREQIRVCGKIPMGEKESLVKEYMNVEAMKTNLTQSENPVVRCDRDLSSVINSQIGRMFDATDKKNVDAAIGRLFFGCGMPFNIARSPLWKEAVRMINKTPQGYVPPSFERLRTTILDDERERIEARLQDIKQSWSTTGVSIVSDGWTDIANRPLINILISSPKGVMFLKSHDTSGHVKDAPYLMGLFRDAIEYVGSKNVVQIITDSASNNVLAGGMIEDEYPSIFWTPCAVHCMNLLLKDLHAQILWIREVVDNAKKIQQFIVNHSMSQAIYRKYSSLQLLKCVETRFASQFIMIDRILKVRQALREMVVSIEWDRWRSRPSTSSTACDEIFNLIIGNESALFWEQAKKLVTLCFPIFEVLRLFDNDKPCMGDVFESLDQMRERLLDIFKEETNLFDEETTDIVWTFSEKRWRMLHSPLHSIGLVFNPKWFHKKPWEDDEVYQGWQSYIDRFHVDQDERVQIKAEYGKYIRSEGNFAHPDCAYDRKALDIFTFWDQYGTGTPLLKNTAIRVLSQVSSASACERNWSEYAFIHSVKRNRLGSKKTEDLVFVHSNLRLISRALPDYKSGPHRMWDYGGSMDDGNIDQLSIEVLENDAEALLINSGHHGS